ncbi:MAG: SRPBCC family protein [Aridibacter sp.]
MNNIEKTDKSVSEFLTDTSTNISKTERVASATAGGALIAYGIKRKDWIGALLSVAGGALALRGATGHCQVYDALDVNTNEKSLTERARNQAQSWLDQKVEVVKSVSINKPAAELYKFWRNFENLPQFMDHLEAVKVIDDKHSEWTAKAPLGMQVHWNATITNDMENRRISWQSDEGADVSNRGMVEFMEDGKNGTVVKVSLKYEPPAGKIGELAAYFLTEEPDTQVEEDLRNFKRLMETGEIITIEGQSSGRAKSAKRLARTASGII